MPDFDFIIVGSGPTGAAALDAILKSGKSVAIVDIGLKPSVDLTERLSALRLLPWNTWPSGVRKSMMKMHPNGVKPKSYFGENFPYDSGTLGIEYQADSPRASVSLGGFSTVWGSTALPFPLGAWPESLSDTYEEIMKSVTTLTNKIGVAGEPGPVEMAYPKSSFTHSLPATSAFTSMVRSESFFELGQRNSFTGLSLPRLAVSERVSPDEPTSGCTSCGLCQVGCPYGHIWSSTNYPNQPTLNRNIVRFLGSAVRIERADTSTPYVTIKSVNDDIFFSISSNHILLAAGPISTAAILLRSQIIDGSITIKDSQTFFVGGVSQKNLAQSAPSSTLAEAISIAPSEDKASISHMQLYGPSEYLKNRLFSSFPAFSIIPSGLQSLLSKHFYVGLGYLDSSESAGLKISFKHANSIQVESADSVPASKIKFTVNEHASNLSRLGIRLLSPSLRIQAVGGGNHLGASLPMVDTRTSTQNNSLWSDLLGRPFGRGNIHVIDSSVLPSVPAGPITMTAMANAYRISQLLST
jgi:ferredoxin